MSDPASETAKKPSSRMQRLLTWLESDAPTEAGLREFSKPAPNAKCSVEVLQKLAHRIDEVDDRAFAQIADTDQKFLGSATTSAVGLGLAFSSEDQSRQRRLIQGWVNLPASDKDHDEFLVDRLRRAGERSAACPLVGLTDRMLQKAAAILHQALGNMKALEDQPVQRLLKKWAGELAQQDSTEHVTPAEQERWLLEGAPAAAVSPKHAPPDLATPKKPAKTPRSAQAKPAAGPSCEGDSPDAASPTTSKPPQPDSASTESLKAPAIGTWRKLARGVTEKLADLEQSVERELQDAEAREQALQARCDALQQKQADQDTAIEHLKSQVEASRRLEDELKAKAAQRLQEHERVQEHLDEKERQLKQMTLELAEAQRQAEAAEQAGREQAADFDRRVAAREVDVRRQIMQGSRDAVGKRIERLKEHAAAIEEQASIPTRKLKNESNNLVNGYETWLEQLQVSITNAMQTGGKP